MASTHFFRGPQQRTHGITSESQGQFPLNRCFCHRSHFHSQFAIWATSAVFSPLSVSCAHWRSPESPSLLGLASNTFLGSSSPSAVFPWTFHFSLPAETHNSTSLSILSFPNYPPIRNTHRP